MTDFGSLIKNIASALPFFLFCLLTAKCNLDRSQRNKQFLMPIISVIYGVVALIFFSTISTFILNFIYGIPTFFSNFWPDAGAFLGNIINRVNWSYYIFYIANSIIIIAYVILKKIAVTIMKAVFKNSSSLLAKATSWLYSYHSFKDVWTVKNEYGNTRTYLKAFYYAVLIISSLLMIVSRYLMDAQLIVSPFFPTLGVIIIGEIFFLFDGRTWAEHLNDVLGEDEESISIVNLSLLRKILRSIFGDKISAENTGVNSKLSNTVSNEELIAQMEIDSDTDFQNLATYLRALNRAGFEIDHSYVESTKDLLKGKSILFNNPFYYDLIPYAFYPMNQALMKHRKVLIIPGRHAITKDIKNWVYEGIGSVTNIPNLWRVGELNAYGEDFDIGIINRSDVHNLEMHKANSAFFDKVGFVVIIEPSKLVTTAQIGLSSLIKSCQKEGKSITYCTCDKNCDGLVDTLSHILLTSITEVSATNKHTGTVSYMCYDADKEYWHHRMLPNISRYLGIGTELSFVALRNQVSKTYWYGGESYPVIDQKWISSQYYYDLLNYAGLPPKQNSMDYHFNTTSNYWSARKTENQYMTVEDEPNNLFEIIRTFSTRSDNQGFVNVISSEYLLKDYMSENYSIFEADCKAIPYIVSDYARTLRNITLRLILMMSINPVEEDIIRKEYSLVGENIDDILNFLWKNIVNCYESNRVLASLNDKEKATLRLNKHNCNLAPDERDSTNSYGPEIIRVFSDWDLDASCEKIYFELDDAEFISDKISELKSEKYIAEDENEDIHFIGNELVGHVYQKYLPGQHFTFDGKYYEMVGLSGKGQVLVRRAADHITGRYCYRQFRNYTISNSVPDNHVGSKQNIDGIELFSENADIMVSTDSYLRMIKYNDFPNAEKITINGIPDRSYNNKQLLRIRFPEIENSPEIRYTITLLLNEVFRTLFAENQCYLAAVTSTAFLKDKPEEEIVNLNTYTIDGDNLDENSIYIIEDSQLDIGLLVTVERNFKRILQIIADYLIWNKEEIEKSLNPPVSPVAPMSIEQVTQDMEKPKKKRCLLIRILCAIGRFFKRIFKAIASFFKKLFGRKGKNKPEDEGNNPETQNNGVTDDNSGSTDNPEAADTAGDNTKPSDTASVDDSIKSETVESNSKELGNNIDNLSLDLDGQNNLPAAESTDISTSEESPEDTAVTPSADEPITADHEGIEITGVDEDAHIETTNDTNQESTDNGIVFDENGIPKKAPYHERYYLLYGYRDPSDCSAMLDIDGTIEFLHGLNLGNNPLSQARGYSDIASQIEAEYDPKGKKHHICDFCGVELIGTEYEVLSDGRERCMSCGNSAVKTVEEFSRIFNDVLRNMEAFFGIKINTGIRVEMTTAKKIAKETGTTFVSTDGFDSRAVGVAIHDSAGYRLLIENGTPRISAMVTIAHELTHIWQYLNWNRSEIINKYGAANEKLIYEGMAMWVEIQYAMLINEKAFAKRDEIITSTRDDEYGRGFLLYLSQYPFSQGSYIDKPTPFINGNTPIS